MLVDDNLFMLNSQDTVPLNHLLCWEETDNFEVEIEYINIELSIKDKDKETYLRIIRFKKELNSSGGIF